MGRMFGCIVVVCALCVGSVHSVFAGMFDLKMGMTKKEVESVLGRLIYAKDYGNAKNYATHRAKSVLTTFADNFEVVSVIIHPEHGLTKVNVSKHVKTNNFGVEVKETYRSTIRSLSKKYGKGYVFDELLPRSRWNRPEDYMMSIIKMERELRTSWSRQRDKSIKWADGLQYIVLEVVPVGMDSALIVIRYVATVQTLVDIEKQVLNKIKKAMEEEKF